MRRAGIFLPVLAWLLSLSPALWLRPTLQRTGRALVVPLVTLPVSERTDVMSDVAGFVIVASWGIICALALEPLKISLPSQNRRWTIAALVICQAVIAVGTVQAHTFDWWIWLKWLFGLGELSSRVNPHVFKFHMPWMSFLAAVSAASVVRYCYSDKHGSS